MSLTSIGFTVWLLRFEVLDSVALFHVYFIFVFCPDDVAVEIVVVVLCHPLLVFGRRVGAS